MHRRNLILGNDLPGTAGLWSKSIIFGQVFYTRENWVRGKNNGKNREASLKLIELEKSNQGVLKLDTRSEILRNKYLDNPIVQLEKPFEDERGAIYPIVDEKMESCVIIDSKKGTVRANHFHKSDWHYCHVLSGKIEYHWRVTGSSETPNKIVISEGQCFFTPPMVDHAMVFVEDTTFLTLGRNPRDQKSYEADVERIELV